MDCGPCPYLEDREWLVEEFFAPSFKPGLYEDLLVSGFRRSGMTFYRNHCEGCRLCVPLRLDAQTYVPSKTLRRLGRLNADLEISLCPNGFREDRYLLYTAYAKARHGGQEAGSSSRASYEAFLINSPLETTMIVDYRLPTGELVANGYVDVLERGFSSVYFAFDPRFGSRSIGVWSVARELELARTLGKRYYYLGFWVPGSPKMDYKARYRPFEYASEGEWHAVPDRAAVLQALGAA